MQYTVKKPINNNILRVVDPTGCELIVTGRGLGFGAKPGYKIEAETVEHSYRMTSPAVQQKLVELLEQIPYEHLLLTDELVAMIRSRVNYPLNESLLITLADHISFAIQRSEQGIRFSNPLRILFETSSPYHSNASRLSSRSSSSAWKISCCTCGDCGSLPNWSCVRMTQSQLLFLMSLKMRTRFSGVKSSLPG